MTPKALHRRASGPLCKLLGCPSYGTKETLVVRLLAQRALRLNEMVFMRE